MHSDLASATATSDLFFVTQSDPVEFADRKRRQREIQTEHELVKWRAWLINNLDKTLELSAADVGEPAIIAWLFPTGAHSRANPEAAAIPRRAMRAAVQGDAALQEAMRKAFDRVVCALGLVERDGALWWRAEALPWALGRAEDRRVYRMLRSVHSAGMDGSARMLMAFLERELGQDAARLEVLRWYRHQVAS